DHHVRGRQTLLVKTSSRHLRQKRGRLYETSGLPLEVLGGNCSMRKEARRPWGRRGFRVLRDGGAGTPKALAPEIQRLGLCLFPKGSPAGADGHRASLGAKRG